MILEQNHIIARPKINLPKLPFLQWPSRLIPITFFLRTCKKNKRVEKNGIKKNKVNK